MFTKIYEFMVDVPNHSEWVAGSAVCSLIVVGIVFALKSTTTK